MTLCFQVKKDAGDILIRLFSNVLKDPQSLKFRAVKLSNPKIESKLLVANGAFEILFSSGFEVEKRVTRFSENCHRIW